MPTPTKTQARYLSFIHAYTETAGQPPSMQDVAEALGVSSPSVNGMFKTLEKNGLIERVPSESRSVEVLVDPATLPKWRKKINIAINLWCPKDASQEWVDERINSIIGYRKAQRAKAQKERRFAERLRQDEYFRFKITLIDSHLKIWRRIETKDVDLGSLNELIQTAMGWTNSHMHQFVIGGEYFWPREVIEDFGDDRIEPYDDLLISDLIDQFGNKLKFHFEYDFGDGWQHEIKLEKVLPLDSATGEQLPRCTAGKNACPPEDCGGAWGYAEFLEAVSDPQHKLHEHYMEWCGPFDPEAFDVDDTTRIMREGMPYMFGRLAKSTNRE